MLLSVMGITLEEIEINAALPINPTIIRIMRVLRIARGEGWGGGWASCGAGQTGPGGARADTYPVQAALCSALHAPYDAVTHVVQSQVGLKGSQCSREDAGFLTSFSPHWPRHTVLTIPFLLPEASLWPRGSVKNLLPQCSHFHQPSTPVVPQFRGGEGPVALTQP